MNKIFCFSNNYASELRCSNCLPRSNIHSEHFGIEPISNIVAKIKNRIPNEIKVAWYLTVLKSKIKK